jgi:Predicted transcriptional regulators
MNSVGLRIRKHREESGITQEYIANEMGITQSTYGRLEKSDKRLSVDRLIEIAKILDISISVLFGEKASNIIHENNGDNAQAHIGTIVHQDKEYISSLKEEINFLRKMLSKNQTE